MNVVSRLYPPWHDVVQKKRAVSKETRLRMSIAHLGKPSRKHVPVEVDGKRFESPKDLMEAKGWTKSRVRWLLKTGRIRRLAKDKRL